MTTHPDLPTEQAYLDRAYEHLARMRSRTRAAASLESSAAGAVDSAIAQRHLQARLRTLDVEVDGLSFGRLDADDGDTWYVGRRHVEDERGDPVVVDWRAPVSTPFYRATAADPMELQRRRRFVMTKRHVDDLFDEVFDDPDSVDAAHHGGIPDPLLAELERSRTGEMRDIVATIAAEQDVVIRSPLDTCLVVQGGPGHRQDGRRPAPGGVPALRAPRRARPRGRPRRRAQPAVPALHRPGAARRSARRRPARPPWSGSSAAACAESTSPRWCASRATSGWPRCSGPPPGSTCARRRRTSPSAPPGGRCASPPPTLARGHRRDRGAGRAVRRRSQRLPHASTTPRLARPPRLQVGGRRARPPRSTPRCAPTPSCNAAVGAHVAVAVGARSW